MAVTGWTGKLLRVNLASGKISTDDTMKYKAFLGGAGLGYKVLFDEVPQGTKALSAENKIVIGAGPLTGAGAPLSGRSNITSLSPMSPYNMVVDGHMGGNFGVMMKFAGYDAIIIEGASAKPVWLKVLGDKVSLEDASALWGKGTVETSFELNKIMGKEACIGCIGQAGETQVHLSSFVNSLTHSGGGHGAVFGFKKLKAIGVYGNQPVRVADSQKFLELNRYMLSDILGSNNNHAVPSTPQSWAEFSSPSSRWTARPGLTWGGAEPVVETGECPPQNINKVGLRTQMASFMLGPESEDRTVHIDGCHSCPLRCQCALKMPELEQYGLPGWGVTTCINTVTPMTIITANKKQAFSDGQTRGKVSIIAKMLSARLHDDYGLWSNYGQLGKDFAYCYTEGIFKKVLPKDEYNSIPWNLLEDGDPAFLIDIYRRLAMKEGEFSHLADGSAYLYTRWNLGEEYANDGHVATVASVKFGYPKHHHTDEAYQVGTLLNTIWNRDANSHSHLNFIAGGLPYAILKEIAEENWGVGALDAPKSYTPMNQSKARFTKWSIDRNMLHDSITLCNWVWPMTLSPTKARKYRGDKALEAKFFSAVTGIATSEAEMDTTAERITTLHRALTVKELGTTDMRNQHDTVAPWAFKYDNLKPFTEGSVNMDHDDMELAFTMLYREYGWDEKTGAPTKATLIRLGMADVAAELEKLNLLP